MAFRDGKATCTLCDTGGGGGTPGAHRFNIEPAGAINGVNRIFTTPEDFVHNGDKTIRVYRNGQRQTVDEDYTVSESGGVGTGFDTVTFAVGCTPKTDDVVLVDYVAA